MTNQNVFHTLAAFTAAFCFLVIAIFPAETLGQDVRGTVTDAGTGEPIPGVNVVVQETTIGTTTDADGEYELSVPSGDVVLVFSFVGYLSQEIPVEEREEINVVLELDVAGMEEIVVVGYGSQRRANLTGSVDQVSAQDIEHRAAPNLTQSLQGMMPNVNVRPLDGKPTESPSINIRGTTSIGQGGNALVLIDGVEGDPSMLNPEDVESISVLKDASSAAVYGARGAFGVVLITTKDPEPQAMSVRYSGSISAKQPTVATDFVTDPVTWATMFDTAFRNYFGTDPQNVNKTMQFSQGYLAELERRANNPDLPRTEVNEDGLYTYYHGTDWFDLLYKDTHYATNHDLSVSRSTENTSFMVSGRYQGQEGLFRYNSDDYQMLNLRSKGSIDLFGWLHLTNNFDFSKRDYINPLNVGEGGGIWRNIADEGHPLSPMLNPDGTLTHSASYTVGDLYLGNNNFVTERRVLRNTIGFDAQVIEGLMHVLGDFSFQTTNSDERRRRVPVPYSRAPGSIEYVGTQFNDIRNIHDRTNYIAANLYTEYENQFDDNHYFKGMVGANYEQSTFKRMLAQRNGLIFPDVEDLNLALGQSLVTQGGYERWRILGGFTRINYIYDERYLLEINARYDGSSKFPDHERFAFFPSASIGWRLSEEAFWPISDDIVNHLQLRGSYGSMGNGNISSYVYQQTFDIYQLGRIVEGARPQATSRPAVLPDGLTWETATTANIGIDLEMFNGRLQFTGDAYVRETTNMFTRGLTPPAVFGAAPPFGNYADLRTQGWELMLGWRDQFQVGNSPLSYHFSVNLSDYQAEITRYNNPEKFLDDFYEGMVVGEIWGYVSDGFFVDQADIDNHADQHLFFMPNNHDGQFRPGDVKFRDLNGDGIISPGDNTLDNPGDRRIIGNTTPRYSFGVNMGASWSNFFVGAFFQGVGKQDWYPSSEASHFWGQYNRAYADIPRWHLEQGIIWSEENPDSFFPRYTGYMALGGSGRTLQATQTAYVMNAAYIRLKNLQVGYNLPENLIAGAGMRNARVYVSGENLWSWSPLYRIANNVDVEAVTSPSDQLFTGSNAGDGYNYPRMRSVTMGVSLTF